MTTDFDQPRQVQSLKRAENHNVDEGVVLSRRGSQASEEVRGRPCLSSDHQDAANANAHTIRVIAVFDARMGAFEEASEPH